MLTVRLAQPSDAPAVQGIFERALRAADWLPAGPLTVGLTAGASTPNNKIGEVVAAVARLRGIALEGVAAS